MPDVGIQVPPNLADWWPRAGARRARPTSAGCRANGDHISPEHPFPSPHQVRKRLAADGVALTERLCVYPQYIDPEWVDAGRARRRQDEYWSFIPRARLRAARTRRADPARPRRRRDRAGPRGRRADAEELTALFAETRPEAIEDMRQAADELRAELAGETVTFVVNRNINVSNVCIVGCAFCGFGQGKRSPDAYEHDEDGVPSRASTRRSSTARPSCACSRASIPTGRSRTTCAGCGWPRRRAAAAPARVLADGDRAHVRHLRPAAGRGLRAAARRRARLDARAPPPRCSTTACASASARTSCRSRAGSRSSRRRTAPGCAPPRR